MSSNLDDLFCQLKTNRENFFIIIPLPRPLRQALCGGLFPSFQRRKGMQPQGREIAAKRKGRRAAAMRGGERRQRAHAPSATVEKNPRTGKGRQQQPRGTSKDNGQRPRAEARAAEFSTSVEKFFRSYYTFLSKALTMAVFCGMMKKKAPFCTYLCGSVFLKGKHNAICDLNCALCGCARAGIRAVLRP